jgi:hypothetical protein
MERMKSGFITLTSTCALKHDLIVETQPKLGHARKVALHLHRAEDLRSNDVSVCVHLVE